MKVSISGRSKKHYIGAVHAGTPVSQLVLKLVDMLAFSPGSVFVFASFGALSHLFFTCGNQSDC